MAPAEFIASLSAATPPDLAPPLVALWRDAKGDWSLAHKCVDTRDDADGMWVHAYLHRKEGDLSNARYWYARAGRPPASGSLEVEFAAILAALLARATRETGSK
ncbi:MAG: hypothetical protein F9K41_14015 [Sphingopyxis terrae]|nr:MAG: hypothetical protein F9K41_14015 [Sphingopyxis terrae]PWB83414.1 MAG: hypothetical protein C3F11_06820 [Methylocystaceae bacterium]